MRYPRSIRLAGSLITFVRLAGMLINFARPAGMLIALLLTAARLPAQPREEFNGPFAGWANGKDRFGARGDGSTDDTKALQKAIDSLGVPPDGFRTGPGAYMVIYLPAGTYCISSTLILKGKIAVTIVGEDPGKTIIRWTGKDSTSMLWSNGSSYFRISRLSWDAGGHKGMEGIGIHWRSMWHDKVSRSFAPLNIEISDNWFVGGLAIGLGGGTTPSTGTSSNDSEITIRRCLFRGCTFSGIEITGFNALDYWISDCRFLRCANGVRCAYGGYHLYRSFFSASTVSDVHNNNGYYNSIRGCYSVNANDFSSDEGASSNPFKRVFQDDTVISPVHLAIRHNHLGKLTLLGNYVGRSTDTSVHFSVYYHSWFPGNYEALSLHNTYGYPQPIKIDQERTALYSYGDRLDTTLREDTLRFLRTLEPTPAYVARKIFEVPAKADAAAIQTILDAAGALKGQRPIVHFGMGSWSIDRTLEIPAGSDMQLIGDGWLYCSIILPANTETFRQHPLLHVNGPSFITIKELELGSPSAKGQAEAIVFDKIDQQKAQVHLDQLYSPGADTSLAANRLNYLYIEKDNSFFTPGNYIVGGSLVRRGKGTARVWCFGGQFARLTLEDNAVFVAKDCWWEGPEHTPLDLSGEGSFTLDGAMIAPYKADSTTKTVHIDKFKGTVSLMNLYLQGSLDVQPDNRDLHLLVWNIHFYHKMAPLEFLGQKTNFQGAFLGLNAQCFSKEPYCRWITSIDDQQRQIKDLDAFLDSQTAGTRTSRPQPYQHLPSGVSNIYLSRVSFGSMGKALVFNGDL